MIVLNGFVKIHRKLIQWGWYQDNVVKGVFLHLLLIASFREAPWQGQTIKSGQVVTSYGRLAEDLGFSIQQVRTAIKKLKSTGEITSKTTNKYQLITVVNWEDYQSFDEEITDKTTGKSTDEQQASNRQATGKQQHRKNVKNVKNDKNNNIKKNNKKKYGEFENVILSDEELQKLKDTFSNYEERIERLSGYIASKGIKYKSHYATIRQWAARDKNDVKISQKIDYDNQELF